MLPEFLLVQFVPQPQLGQWDTLGWEWIVNHRQPDASCGGGCVICEDFVPYLQISELEVKYV